MRRLLVVIAGLILSATAAAQVSNPSIIAVASNPSGNTCSAGVPMLYYGGVYYGCDGTGHYASVSGSGSFNALSGDAVSTATGGATTVLGIENVPFCTGFTPANGQAIQYTTGSSPNPCYTAATEGGGTTANALTAAAAGGAAPGTTFNGSAARTFDYSSFGASPLAGSTSLTTLGTISTGTWHGTALALGYGGTGAATDTAALSNILGNPASGTYAIDCTSTSSCTTTASTGAVSSVSNSDSSLTVTPTTGAVVASLNVGHANTWSALQTFTAGIAAGSSAPSVTAGTGGVWAAAEGTAPSGGVPASGVDAIYADSTDHQFLVSLNNGSLFQSLMNFSTVNLASSSAGGVTGLLPVANGGNGTGSPGITCASGCTVGGSWPTQAITVTGGGSNTITGSGLTQYSVYYQASGGLTLAEANASTTLPAICIAATTTTCQYSGTLTDSSWTWTSGQVLYLSDGTAGTLTATAPSTSGHYIQRVAVALSATQVLIQPSLDVGGIQ